MSINPIKLNKNTNLVSLPLLDNINPVNDNPTTKEIIIA